MPASPVTAREPSHLQPDEAAAGSGGALRAALLGAVLGVDVIGYCLALATLIFAGPLAAGLGLGTAVFLLGTVVVGLVLTFRSTIPGAIGLTQDSAAAPLAAAVAVAAGALAGPTEARLATALAILAASTLLSGAAMWAIGRARLGRVARAMPYPVAAGFLASSGWLLAFAALQILLRATDPRDWAARLLETEALLNLVPAIILALAMLAAVKLRPGALLVLLLIFGSLAAFHAALPLLGLDLVQARALGLLPDPPTGAISLALGPDLLGLVAWDRVAMAAPTLAAVVLINLVSFVLNSTGAETATGADADIDRELRVTGLANLGIGAFGGLAGFVTTVSTSFAHGLGVRHRALPLTYCAVALLGCVLAPRVVAVVPVFVATGLILYFGLAMLDEWLWQTRRRLVAADWAIVLAIVVVTATAGILAAIVLGLLAAMILFVVSYARVPTLRRVLTGLERRSAVDRAPAEERALDREGGRIRILVLQGYLFFGSVERLADEVRAAPGPRGAPGARRWAVLDFGGVTGLDSSACASLEKLAALASREGLSLHVASLPAAVAAAADRWAPGFLIRAGLPAWPDADAALEACEAELLSEARAEPVGAAVALSELGGGHPRLPDLLTRMERQALAAGEVLIERGALSRDVFLVDTGQLGVFVPRDGGGSIRVRSMTAGALLGEVAAYLGLPRTAEVRAETASTVLRLDAGVMARIEREDRDLAALMHEVLARALADKLARTNRLLAGVR